MRSNFSHRCPCITYITFAISKSPGVFPNVCSKVASAASWKNRPYDCWAHKFCNEGCVGVCVGEIVCVGVCVWGGGVWRSVWGGGSVEEYMWGCGSVCLGVWECV